MSNSIIFDTAIKAPKEDAEPIYINDALNTGRTYYCPFCYTEVHPRRQSSDGRSAGFVHKKGSSSERIGHDCESMLNTDAYYKLKKKVRHFSDVTDEMSEWHIAWQQVFEENGFTLEYKETDENGRFCRADAINKKLHTVVEFQHSHIEEADFKRRNDFWCRRGYRTIWLFDFEDYWRDNVSFIKPEDLTQNMRNRGDKYYHIDRYHYILGDFYPQAEPNTTVFIENIINDGSKRIRRLTWTDDNKKIISLERYDHDGFMNFCINHGKIFDINTVMESRNREATLRAERAAKKKLQEEVEAEKKRQADIIRDEKEFERKKKEKKISEDFIPFFTSLLGTKSPDEIANIPAHELTALFTSKTDFSTEEATVVSKYLSAFITDIHLWRDYTDRVFRSIKLNDNDNYNTALCKASFSNPPIYKTNLLSGFCKEQAQNIISTRISQIAKQKEKLLNYILENTIIQPSIPFDGFLYRIKKLIQLETISEEFKKKYPELNSDLYEGELIDNDIVRTVWNKITNKATTPICRICNSPKQLKTNRTTGEEFWGCPNYKRNDHQKTRY